MRGPPGLTSARAFGEDRRKEFQTRTALFPLTSVVICAVLNACGSPDGKADSSKNEIYNQQENKLKRRKNSVVLKAVSLGPMFFSADIPSAFRNSFGESGVERAVLSPPEPFYRVSARTS